LSIRKDSALHVHRGLQVTDDPHKMTKRSPFNREDHHTALKTLPFPEHMVQALQQKFTPNPTTRNQTLVFCNYSFDNNELVLQAELVMVFCWADDVFRLLLV
jgi:hypothetical protein